MFRVKFGRAVVVPLVLLLIVALCAGLLKLRGFRATSTPSPFEATVARSIRNFAIPAAERRSKNPVAGDWSAIQHAPQDFLPPSPPPPAIDPPGPPPLHSPTY